MASHDLYITVFSPEGRLHQIEYAFKAIKDCNRTSIGVKSDEAVVVCTQKIVEDKFVDASTVSNIYKITPNVGVLITGRDGDGQSWITSLRQKAYDFLQEFGTQITSDILAQFAANIAQLYTQRYSMRAYAVELMFFSYDDEKKSQLFKIDPAGHFAGYFGCTSGVKDQEAESQLDKQFKQLKGFGKLNKNELIFQAIKALQNTIGQDFRKTDIEIAYVEKSSQVVVKLKEEEIEQFLLKVQRLD